MALIGNYIKHTIEKHQTETEELIINNPDGSEEKVVVPKLIDKTENFENVYVIISHYMFYPINLNENGEMSFDFQYKIYNSKEDRTNNPNSYIEEGNIIGRSFNID